MKKEFQIKKIVPNNFLIAMSVVSIIGFLSIISESIFFISIKGYIETLWLITLGVGLIFETSLRELRKIKKKGLDSILLGKVTMIVIGSMAIIAGLLSLPQISLNNPSFLAVKGIISIIAIIFIIIETWVKPK